MGKEALVVNRSVLFEDGEFEGFVPIEQRDFSSAILNNYTYHERGDKLENDDSLQQVIPYVWIVNPAEKKVFAYRRATGDDYDEKRLRDKWSCGLGGHVDREDSGNPIQTAMMRELMEEVKISQYPDPKIVGYLNLNHDVHAVHFGVVAIAETALSVEKGDDEMAEGRFFSISELEELFAEPNNDVEEWTTESWPFVKKYLEGL